MKFGKNLQYLRSLRSDMTQEQLAVMLGVSRQTVSKWELNSAYPEMNKAVEICRIFNCSLDNLFREDMAACSNKYSNIRIENVSEFRYVKYTVISSDPETDALERIHKLAAELQIEKSKVIGWDFPFLSQEQKNVYNMHGYSAALILPDEIEAVEGYSICSQDRTKYAAIHIEKPYDNPFVTIPGAYKTLMNYMQVNGLKHKEKDVIPCFETDGMTMDIYIACE